MSPLLSKLAMSTWNYRVVRQEHNGEVQYGVHEAYDNGTSWTMDPVAAVADSVEELRAVLAAMSVAPEFAVIQDKSAAREMVHVQTAEWSRLRGIEERAKSATFNRTCQCSRCLVVRQILEGPDA